MRTYKLYGWLIILSLSLSVIGQTSQSSSLPQPTPYSVVNRSANVNVWERYTYEKTSNGKTIQRKHQYTELASGLNFKNPQTGLWAPSKEEIDILPDGTAAAVNGQHRVHFPGDIYDGVIEMITPDGLHLQSRPLGISYDDGTNTVLVAVLTNSIGQLINSNTVVYPNAFIGLDADLCYIYTKAGLEQDVILHNRPPLPGASGLDSTSTRVQVLTEFFSPPSPTETASPMNNQDGLDDTTLTFGMTRFGRGKAFILGKTVPQIPVYKSWLHLNNRTFLVEQMSYKRLALCIQSLPSSSFSAMSRPLKMPFLSASAQRHLPSQRLVKNPGTHKMQLAKTDLGQKSGVVLDYVTLDTQTNDTYTFQGDRTYLVSGPFYVNNATFEGGSVVKFGSSSNASISFGLGNSPTWETSSYRPAVLTSMNDNSVGETIDGSSGSPTNHGQVYIYCSDISHGNISDARFAYAGEAFVSDADGSGDWRFDFWNCQFVKCGEVLSDLLDETSVNFHNVLAIGCSQLTDAASFSAEQATIDVGTFGGGSLTNSIVIIRNSGVTNIFGGSLLTTNPAAPLFQTAGGGNYYMPTNSSYHGAGSTNISQQLLTEFKNKTTYAPLSYPGDGTWGPQVRRDTNAVPDIGYHYDPIDYLINGDVNATFTSGSVVAGTLTLNSFDALSIGGAATNPCLFVMPDTVQESGSTYGGAGIDTATYDPGNIGNLSIEFTKFYGLANDLFYTDSQGNNISLSAVSCEFYSGVVGTISAGDIFNFDNCLFWRTYVDMGDTNNGTANDDCDFQNCTFWNGQLSMTRDAANWMVENSAFNGTSLQISDGMNGDSQYTVIDHNAYLTNADQLPYDTYPLTVYNFDWQSNSVGNFYLPPGSRLINAGSRQADQTVSMDGISSISLYNYTTLANQTPETNSLVDIGYHYTTNADVSASCVEGGPYVYDIGCYPDAPAFAPSNVVNVAVGQPFLAPILHHLSGKYVQEVIYDCTPNSDYFVTNDFTYTIESNYFVPAIPSIIWVPGTYLYTNYMTVDGLCGILTTTATVTVNVSNVDTLIDIDFGGDVHSSKTGYAAIGDSSSDQWDYYIAGGNVVSGSLTNLPTAEGYTSPVCMFVTNLFAAGNNGSSDPMYGNFLSTNAGAATVTFSNLPAGIWNIYLYSEDGNFDLTAGATDFGTRTCYDPSPSTVLAWEERRQYVVYTNVSVTAGQNVTITILQGKNGAALLSGLQISSQYHNPLNFIHSTSGIVAWGQNSHGETNVPPGLTNVTAISAGANHALALNANGTVTGWGYDAWGQTNVPDSLQNVIAISCGALHSVALKSDGTVSAWGYNAVGQTNVPVGLSNIVAIAAGTYHNLALKSDGTVTAWGDDSLGECDIPVGLSNVIAITAGYYDSLALKADGTVTAWGYNQWGETNVPQDLNNVVAISTRYGDILALKSDGTVIAWGLNNVGQTNVPVGLSNVVAVAAGRSSSTVLKADGTVLVWGFNSSGQTNVPSNLSNVVEVAAGDFFNVALCNPAVPASQIASLYRAGASGRPDLTADSDYDGIGDIQELANRTDPNNSDEFLKLRLAYFPFDNTNTWVGNAGQLPLLVTNIVGVPSWSTNAVLIDGTTGAILKYRDVETNGNANINLRNGTIRFWFKPDWNSADAGGSGPQTEGRLLEIGAEDSSNGWWGLVIGSSGTNFYFGTQTNSTGTLTTNLTAAISWTSNVWHQIVLTYSTNGSSIYFDGQSVVTNGSGVAYYPGLTARSQGFTIGSDASCNHQAQGTFDELETFNYPLNAQKITDDYSNTLASRLYIVSQPQNQTVIRGSNAMFSVTALGATPMSYQWYFNGDTALFGATASIYTKLVAQLSDMGNYSAAITNAAASLISANASLTVIVPPIITQQPTNITAALGGSATFNVGLNSDVTTPLSYQWYFNGTEAIANATNQSLVLSGLNFGDAGSYSVTISNVAGTITSIGANLTVVGISNIIVDGSDPQIVGSTAIAVGDQIVLRAIPFPPDATFPAGYPTWSVVGGSVTLPSDSSPTGAVSSTSAGQYTIWASCGISNSFVLAVAGTNDSDYDGIPDNWELNANPQTMLGSWRFDTPDWVNLEGQLPIYYTNLWLVLGWYVGSVNINSNNGPASLIYPEINTNTSMANIVCRQGSVRFMLLPDWNGTNANGIGPGNEARLFEIGTKDTTNGCWGLYLNSSGTNLYFCSLTNLVGEDTKATTNVCAMVQFDTNTWHQIILTYSASNSSLYLDGLPIATNGSGVANWPGSSVRGRGFSLGNGFSGTNWLNGRIDNFETFNYVLGASNIFDFYTNHPQPMRETNYCDLAPIALYFPFVQALTNYQEVWLTNNSSSGNFLWLSWSNDNLSDGDLIYELNHLDSVKDYTIPNTTSNVPLYIGDWIRGGTGTHSVNLDQYTNSLSSTNPIPLGIVLSATPISGTGGNGQYQAAAFATINLISYSLTTSDRYLHFIYRGARACDAYYPNQPPTNYIISPFDLQVFTSSRSNGVVPITTAAHDPEDGLTNVAFYAGTNANCLTNLIYYQAVTNADTNLYTFTWTNAPHGTNYLMTVATDEFGASATSQVVRAFVNWPPQANAGSDRTIIWPDDSTNLTLSGTAFDPDNLPCPLTNTWSVISSNGLVTFQDINLTNTQASFSNVGTYILQLTASDGAVSASSRCTITIKQRPFISITWPTDGYAIPSNSITALYAGAIGTSCMVTNVEFFDGTTGIGMATEIGNSTNYALAWTTTNLNIGSHSLTAVATDNNGLSATSAVVSIFIYVPIQVFAGLDQIITLPQTNLTLSGSVTDSNLPQGAPLVTAWSVVSSNGPVSFDDIHLTNAVASFVTNGLYTLRLTGSDAFTTNNDEVMITVNESPVVDAGAEQIISLIGTNVTVSLDGSITDDGLPIGAPINSLWTVVSAPGGTVTISNATLSSTFATFTNSGSYTLRLTANDTVSTNSADVTIIINRAPSANAGTNQVLVWEEGTGSTNIILAGTASDDGFPYGTLTTTWSSLFGPATVSFGSASLTNSTATFSTNGTYALQLIAGDGMLQATSSCSVYVERRPFISIISPTNAQSFSPGVIITNLATAYDLDGSVTHVTFFNNGTNVGSATADSITLSRVAWWRAEDNAKDCVGTNNGTFIGEAYTVGMVGQTFDFNGSNAYVQVASSPAVRPTGPFTVAAWINYRRISDNQAVSTIVAKGTNEWSLGISSANKLRLSVTAGNVKYPLDGSTTLTTNAWYFISMVYDGTNLTAYLNGQADGSRSLSGALSFTNLPFEIGASQATSDGSFTNGFNGLIDEVSLYNRASSSNEVQTIYANSTNNVYNYTFIWTNAPSGTNVLTAVATDNDGLTKTSSPPVIVTVVNPLPTVQIVSPIDQTFVARTNITFDVTATNYNGTPIQWVELFANSTNLGYTAMPNAGYYQFNWIAPTGGVYVFTALAMDVNSNSAWSEPVTNTIRNLPLVSIITPTNGSILIGPTNILIQATALGDQATVTNVVFYQGTNILGMTNAGSPYAITWTNVGFGTYSLTARAMDNLGELGVSFPVNIRVVPTNSPPSVNPGNDQTNRLPDSVQLNGLVFDDGLPVGSTLNIGWQLVSGPSGGTVTFSNSNAPITTASFSTTGVYVLQLSANDSQYTVSKNLTITVLSTNFSPVVNAGADQSLAWPSSGNSFIKFNQFLTAEGNIINLDYYATSNEFIFLRHNGSSYELDKMPATGGSVSSIYSASWMNNYAINGKQFILAKTNVSGFTPGDIFTVNGDYKNEIMNVHEDGTLTGNKGSSGNAWAAFNAQVVAMCFDDTGVYDNDLIVLLGDLSVWRVDSIGNAIFIGSFEHEGAIGDGGVFGGLVVVPNDIQKYGPLAGCILVVPTFTNSHDYLAAMNRYGFYGDYNIVMSYAYSGMSIIPKSSDLLMCDGTNILKVAVAQLGGLGGEIILGNDGGALFKLHWNGRTFEIAPIGVQILPWEWRYCYMPHTNAVNPFAQLQGTVTDDGIASASPSIQWIMLDGPGNVTFDDPSKTNTIARFTEPGTYLLRLTANDGEKSSSDDVTIAVGVASAGTTTNGMTLMPSYSAVLTNTFQTLTVTLQDATGMPLANTNVQFIVNGANPSTNSAVTDTNGMAQLTYAGTNIGRDFIQVSAVTNGQTILSQTATVDWTRLLDCGVTNDASISTNDAIDTEIMPGESRYADFYTFYGQQWQQIDLTYLSDYGLMFAIKDSSNQVLETSFKGAPTGPPQEMAYTLPYSGFYTLEVTTITTNDYHDPWTTDLSYSLTLSCSITTTNRIGSALIALLDGTNIPSGSTLGFGTTVTNIPVAETLVLTNPGTADVHLNSLFVGGDFSAALDASTPREIDNGVYYLPPHSATSLRITFNATNSESAIGQLSLDNDAESPWFLSQVYALTLTGTATLPGGEPVIRITDPDDNAKFIGPANVTVSAATNGSVAVDYVTFEAQTPQGQINLGNVTNAPFTLSWQNVAVGDYALIATAVSSVTNRYLSPPIHLSVLSPYVNHPPVAHDDDNFTVAMNSSNNVLYPLANDSDPDNDSLTIIAVTPPAGQTAQTPPQSGTATIVNGGTAINYTPPYFAYGSDYFRYEISDGKGGTSWATVRLAVNGSDAPQATLTANSYSVTAGVSDALTASVAPSNAIVEVDFYRGLTRIDVVTNGNNGIFTLSWQATYGNYGDGFTATAIDIFGQRNTSEPIYITVNPPSGGEQPPMASINTLTAAGVTSPFTNMVPVRDGIFDLNGQVQPTDGYDADWDLAIYSTDGTLIRDLTNGVVANGSSINGYLATCDLSGLENGVYTMKLYVSSHYMDAESDVLFRLESNLKIGQFSFSQQDVSIPVNGIPLTITRTYNSLNPKRGDFGYGWTFAINSMDISLDETREDVVDMDGETFSQRTGGGRDVTLTLPDGRRTTFNFTLRPDIGSPGTYYAEWKSAPGVNATLEPVGDNRLQTIIGGISGNEDLYYWQASGPWTPMEAYDFPGFTLTTKDGTQYKILRDSEFDHFIDDGGEGYYVQAYGPPYLSEIDQRSGDKIFISRNGVTYQAPDDSVRNVSIQRNEAGLISAVVDPNSSSSVPSVKYEYDSQDNLVRVLTLVDRDTGAYTTNSFAYENASFPHYITGIFNADGSQVAKNIYDDDGRLTAVKDANGILTQFIHNETNNMEVVIDRLGHANTYVYDLRGNVIIQTNALNEVSTMAYDENNNKTNEVTYLGDQPYATNSYTYDLGLNAMLSSTDPLGHRSVFAYDGFGNLTNSIDANGHGTTNVYDTSTGNLVSTTDALGNTTQNTYQNGLLASSEDAMGITTENFYDGSDNLTGTATYDSGNSVLSTNTFTYDSNGNRLTSTVWRRVNGTWTAATTTYIYDAMNRVVQTITPDGGTNTVIYDATGKQKAAMDALGRTTTYAYDTQGRLVRTTYPDQTYDGSVYDANGNRIQSIDRALRTTSYSYDALNRLVETIYPDGATNATVYDSAGRVAQTIDARGTITAFAYDTAGRRVAVTNAFGTDVQSVTSYGYDADGNQVTFTDADNNTTTNVFDVLNRETQVIYANGTTNFTGYDADGRRVAQTNQDGAVTGFGYDGAGRLISVTNAVGATEQTVTRYQYDETGNETMQIDALNRTNIYFYDDMGRRVAHRSPGGQTEGFTYDLVGNMLAHTNFDGRVLTNGYSAMNELINRGGSGVADVFTYSSSGQRSSARDENYIGADNLQTYGYDQRDRLIRKSVAWFGTTPAAELTYQYDADGNVTRITADTVNGVDLQYAYDPLNRLTNVLANGMEAAAYRYDLAGNLVAMSYGNGVTNQYIYDSVNRLTNLVWKYQGAGRAGFAYQLKAGGTRTNLVESINYSAGINHTNQWSYDHLYRLTGETVVGLGVNPQSVTYQYDPAGNRTNRVSGISGLANATYTYSTNDEMTVAGGQNYTYDGDGNATGSANLQYDAMNRLRMWSTPGSGTDFVGYDGDGNRILKHIIDAGGTESEHYYLVDDRNPSGYPQVLEEFYIDDIYFGTLALSRVYNYGLNLVNEELCDDWSTPTNEFYYGYDGHGSVRFLMDTNANITDTYTFDAYGSLLVSNGNTPNNYLYSGYEYDFDLNLYNNRARIWNPNFARFYSRDGDYGSNEDPLSLHKYLYGADNPINKIDPSGHDLIDVMSAIYVQAQLAAIRLAPVITVGRYAAATAFVAGMTFDQEFRDNAVAMGPDVFMSTAGEVTAVISELRGMYMTQRTIRIAAPQVAKLGDTILKDVDDEMLVHFAPLNAIKKIDTEGLKYTEGGVGTHFFKVGEAKNWTPQQAKAAIGDLAGSSLDISGACIVDPSKLDDLQAFQQSFWTEYVTKKQSVMPEAIFGISAQ